MVRDSLGKWLNSSVFREEAIKFIKTKNYCTAPKGSPDWVTYWTEQLRRCIEGYSIVQKDGSIVKITGHHYFYLNFTQIQVVKKLKNSKASRKISINPDFWDGDYEYFWCLEIAKSGVLNQESQVYEFLTEEERLKLENEEFSEEELANLKEDILYSRLRLRSKPHPDYLDGGNHMIVGKARRKGYSYKNGGISVNTYNTVRKAQIIISAFEKKFLYPQGTMAMASNYLNFLNENTGWTKSRDSVDKVDHKKASYKEKVNGVEIEKGYMSEIFAVTFKDNPDSTRGKDPTLILLEEAGAFPNLKDAYAAIKPSLGGGMYTTGQAIIFGTGGDMGSGTIDFADMFYHPETYGLMPFLNIWDDNSENSYCGFFHPVTWNLEGFYDEQGNSDIESATKFEEERRRKIIKTSSSSVALQKHIQEFPFKPSEAFLTVSTNNFPVVELREQLNKVVTNNLQESLGTPVELYYEGNEVRVRPDLEGKLQPVYNYRPKITDLSGAVVIYEYPVDNPPKGLYKIGYDPYRHDRSSGNSLASLYVYKSSNTFSYTRDQIVAEYVGRPPQADDVNRLAVMIAELYNAEIMHENEVTHVINYFRRHRKLHLLAVQPDNAISKSIKRSSVSRVYGIHMPDKIKEDGEIYIKDWLLQERDVDETGRVIRNYETIYSIGLLEELIEYNRKGNFDRVMSFMMIMFQLQEESLNKEYEQNKTETKIQSLIDFLDNKNSR